MEQETFLDKVKKIVEWVVTPLLIIGSYIVYLLSQNRDLREKNAAAEAGANAIKAAAKVEQDNEKNVQETSDYESVRAAYLKQHPDEDPSGPKAS